MAPGAPCTPFSRMGKGMGEDDPVFQVHDHYYEVIPEYADFLLLENVTEYGMEQMVHSKLGKNWGCVALAIDPRIFGLGCARARNYCLAFKKAMFRLNPNISVGQCIEALKARPVMDANNFFYLKTVPLSRAITMTTSDEALLELVIRYKVS